MKLSIRDQFPNLTVETTKGVIHLPEDYAGKWFVLFSHPADFTPVCTTEFVAFQKKLKKFKELGTELIGLSIDNLDSHHQWIHWIKDNLHIQIDFPVIADQDKKISEALGLIHPNAGDTDTVRAVIVVDFKGRVRAMIEYPKEIGRNIDEVLRLVTVLNMASRKKVFAPANWPHNEIIGDKVLFHRTEPANDQKDKEAGITALSDWFVYKNIEY